MKEEREKQAARLANLQSPALRQGSGQVSNLQFSNSRKSKNTASKEERRKIAQLQELENTIAELEATLANLGSQLESPFVKPEEAGKLGTEYERVQKEMDAKLGEWERMQVEI